jgi:hypothetical protein
MGLLVDLGQNVGTSLYQTVLERIALTYTRRRGLIWACPSCGGRRLKRRQSRGYSFLIWLALMLLVMPLTIFGFAAAGAVLAGALGIVGVADVSDPLMCALYLACGLLGLGAWTAGMGGVFVLAARRPPELCRGCGVRFPLASEH